ncbi:MAG: hypothetical protein KAG98_04675 [Lentisphaeria bacterium]|nr:hypothetical protein [Lentisphaeria bacterium]
MRNKLMIMACSALLLNSLSAESTATPKVSNKETTKETVKETVKEKPVVAKEPVKNVGLKSKMINQLKITSNSSELDYTKRTLIFTGAVVVKDPQIELEADLMKITFTPTEEIESFKATSKFDDVVIIVHREGEEDIIAKGEEVHYDALTGKVTLRGESTSIKNGSITNVGAKKIIFFLEDNGLTNFKIIGRSTTIMERDSNLLKKRSKKKKEIKNDKK